MTDSEIIKGLQSNLQKERDYAGKSLFELTFRQIAFIVGNDQEKAKELFQDAYIALMKQIIKPDWKIEAKLSTYFCNTAKYIFWKIKDKEKNHFTDLEKAEQKGEIKRTDEDLISLDEKDEIGDFLKRKQAWEQLGKSCRELLYEKNKHHVEPDSPKKGWKELAEKFGSTENYLKKKASECRKKLQNLLNSLTNQTLSTYDYQ